MDKRTEITIKVASILMTIAVATIFQGILELVGLLGN